MTTLTKGPVLTQAAPPDVSELPEGVQEEHEQVAPQEIIGKLPEPPELKLPYEIPKLSALPLCPLSLQEGMRVNFASLEELELMLTYGYLELECFIQGRSAFMTVRKSEVGQYTSVSTFAGERQSYTPVVYRRLPELLARMDLHPFHWYPYNGLQ